MHCIERIAGVSRGRAHICGADEMCSDLYIVI